MSHNYESNDSQSQAILSAQSERQRRSKQVTIERMKVQ